MHTFRTGRRGDVPVSKRLLRVVACFALVLTLRPQPAAAAGGNPAPPAPPTTYRIPSGALTVTNSSGLIKALQGTTPRDIVLKSGNYSNSTFFNNVYGHRIYSATLGGAVLRAGLAIGGNSGTGNGLVQGVTFDVTEPARTLQNSIVHVWGTGTGTRILDSTFSGHSSVGAGIMVRQPEGAVIQRVRVRDFTDYGVLVDANVQGLVVVTPSLLEDIDVANVSRAVPRSSNGTAEACVWVGNTVTLRRALLRSCAWEGLWTGTGTSTARTSACTSSITRPGRRSSACASARTPGEA